MIKLKVTNIEKFWYNLNDDISLTRRADRASIVSLHIGQALL